jgi:hypothetical protein
MYVPGPQLPYDPTVGWKTKPYLSSSRKKPSSNKKWIWIGLVILFGIFYFFNSGWGNGDDSLTPEKQQELPISDRPVP